MKTWLTNFWRENKGLILFILLLTMFRSAAADWNVVPTGSMKPTIIEGDRILVNKLAYDVRLPFSKTSLVKLADPQRGDIIVFDSMVSDLRLVKRVIGVPGDQIYLRNNRLVINGEHIDYTNIKPSGNSKLGYLDLLEKLPGQAHAVRVRKGGSQRSSFKPLRIPDGFYLAMGDNRDHSADSRVIGLVPRDEIIGRTRSVVMSLNYDNYFIPRGDRFLQQLDISHH